MTALTNRPELLARLTDGISNLTTSDEWQRYLNVQGRFHRYSFSNALLIAAQNPNATRIAGFNTWRKLDRLVRKGEKAIWILAPMVYKDVHAQTGDDERVIRGFKFVPVFDISQTDGPDLPEVRPSLLDGAAPLILWADLLDQVGAAGYTVGYADLTPANGRTDFTAATVTLRTALSGALQVKTLAHELAHIQLHAPDVRPAGCDRPRAEVEAESVAYIVTAANGVATDSYTVPYVTGWAGGDRELIASTAHRVLSCARTILTRPEPVTAAAPAPDRVHDHDRAAEPSRPLPGLDVPAHVVQR